MTVQLEPGPLDLIEKFKTKKHSLSDILIGSTSYSITGEPVNPQYYYCIIINNDDNKNCHYLSIN